MNTILVRNVEHDGRLIIIQGSNKITIPVDLIDDFVDRLQKHSTSNGDMCSFVCNENECSRYSFD